MTPQEFIFAILPSIVVSIVMFFFNKKQSKRDDDAKEREELRIEGENVRLNLLLSANKLSYAVAMAIKRGTPNGEVEEGIGQYKKAMDEFKEYERKLVTKATE